MEDLKLTSEEKAVLVPKLIAYLGDELDVEAGQFDAEFLLDFLTKEAGAVLYNRGLEDAHAALAKHIDSFADVVYALEKPVEVRR
tara:strand:- start:204 stop:458 length:255 start_codon:yes stop_codon:yes gene_type:complete